MRVNLLSGMRAKRRHVALALVLGAALVGAAVGAIPLKAAAAVACGFGEEISSSDNVRGCLFKEGVCVGASSAGEESSADQSFEDGFLPNLCVSVPEMIQYPDMPAGCEVYSLTAVLRSLGLDADPHRVASDYLPFDVVGGFSATAYRGSPYVVGGEGLPPAIVRAGNAFLEDVGLTVRFSDATGSSFEDLESIANEGTPVLVWTTMHVQDPGIASPLPAYSFYYLEHCLVLLGSEGDAVSTMDPMVGFSAYDRASFARVFEQCGSMAVLLDR